MKQAIDNNILLKRDADTFFAPNASTENAANFVRNYNEFYRGSTPDENLRSTIQKREINKPPAAPQAKKKDVYLYNFIVHQPKYIYTLDERRMKKDQNHYDKFANDPLFKKAATAFFGVEDEFRRPDYNKRGPIESESEAMTMNRVYGGKVPLHL